VEAKAKAKAEDDLLACVLRGSAKF